MNSKVSKSNKRRISTELSLFVELISDSIKFYFRRISVISLFVVPLFISYFLLIIMKLETFTTYGGLILRYEDIQDVNFITFLIIIGLTTLTAFLHSFLTTGTTLIAVHLRTGTKYALTKLQKDFTFFVMKIFSVKLFLYLLNISSFVVGRTFPFVHLINVAVNCLFTFVPQSIIIEEVKPFTGLKHSVNFIRKNLMLTMYFFGFLLILFILQEVFILIPSIYDFLTLAYNAIFILPLSEILASFLYLEKYSIAGKKTHL